MTRSGKARNDEPDGDEEQDFAALRRSTQKKIDQAFDKAIREAHHHQTARGRKNKRASSSPPLETQGGSTQKRRKVVEDEAGDTESGGGGGFLPAADRDDDGGGGGGFFPPEGDNEREGGGFLPPEQGGGFLTPEMEIDGQDGGGGFMVDEGPSSSTRARTRAQTTREPEESPPPAATHIPLSLIPRALQIMDLAPDEDVLQVFQNAASGWGGQSVGAEQGVSRKDWRAVCAVLLGEEEPVAGEEEDEGSEKEGETENSMDIDDYQEEEEDEDEDVYAESEEEEADESDDEGSQYGAGPTSRRATRSSARKNPKERGDSPSVSGRTHLTLRQRKECKIAYGLFFPDVPPDELEQQRVMIKDVVRVSKVLKQKLTVEEIIEMLELFSTSADKSMGLNDFEQMMLLCRLV